MASLRSSLVAAGLVAVGCVFAQVAGASTHAPTSTDLSSGVSLSTALAEREKGPSGGMDFNSRVMSWAESVTFPFSSLMNALILLVR